jgi:hypothetical protein
MSFLFNQPFGMERVEEIEGKAWHKNSRQARRCFEAHRRRPDPVFSCINPDMIS